MAAIGSNGRYPQHCAENIEQQFGISNELVNLPQAEEITLPVINKKGDSQVQLETITEIQYPHDTFSFLSHNDPARLAQVFGTKELVAAFWAQQDLSDPKLYKHPLLDVPNYATTCFPGKVHSDGVVISN